MARLASLGAVFGGESWSNLSPGAPAPELLEADVVFGQPAIEAVVRGRARFVQLTSAGWSRYDLVEVREALAARGARLCSSSAVYADPCAEHALACMLAASRRLPEAWADRAWSSLEIRRRSRLLRGRTVVILGLGAIGRRLVELLRPFHLRVLAVRRSGAPHPGVEVVDPAGLAAVLPGADFLVDTLPGTAATEGFVSAERLAALPDHAVLINVGRGTTVDQDALVRELASGRLRAMLDVTDPEPLPIDHALWSNPRCRISPHTAGGRAEERAALVDHFLDNLGRFERDQPLCDVVIGT